LADSLVSNQCKSCGGAIQDVNMKHCPHCGSGLDIVQATIDEKNKSIELCQNCGSPVTFNIEKQQFVCDFCHSTFTTKVESDFANLMFEADNLIPFQVPEGLAKKKFYEWLVQGKNVPLDILGKITNISLEQIYIPYMGVNISYESAWSADIGYKQSETYTEYETRKDKNGEKYSVPVTKTRTIINWSHAKDSFSGTAAKSYLINDELSGPIEAFAQNVSEFAFSGLVKPFDEHYTAGTRQLKISSDKVAEALRFVRDAAQKESETKMRELLPGDKNKNAKITKLTYSLTSKYTYVPFWKITYDYEGVSHSVILTAASKEKMELDGNRPVSKEDSAVEIKMKKTGRWGLLGFIPGLLIFLDMFPAFNTLFLIIFLAGIGFWLFFAIKRYIFLRGNKKQLGEMLQDHSEYVKLLKEYPE
jgi:ribosomal protein L37E